jgi:hypothetical protein
VEPTRADRVRGSGPRPQRRHSRLSDPQGRPAGSRRSSRRGVASGISLTAQLRQRLGQPSTMAVWDRPQHATSALAAAHPPPWFPNRRGDDPWAGVDERLDAQRLAPRLSQALAQFSPTTARSSCSSHGNSSPPPRWLSPWRSPKAPPAAGCTARATFSSTTSTPPCRRSPIVDQRRPDHDGCP